MTKERAHEIATIHEGYEIGAISYFNLANGKHLHVQTLSEPMYYGDGNYVTYIDIEDDDGYCIETHTTNMGNVDELAFWIHELCYDTEEV